jgi:hypothetical protein
VSGSEPKPELSRPEPRFIDRDLYCLHCGYNLRGLAGDPVRCPECGYDNPIADAEIPADLIKAQLEKLEPGFAVFAALCFVVFAVLSTLVLCDAPDASAVFCCLIPTALALASWLGLALGSFPKSCLDRPGWFGALMIYHFWALLLLGGFIGLPAMMLIFSGRFFSWLELDRIEVLIAAGVIALALYILAVIICVPWAYRRATRAMTPLQRDVALTIARTEIQRRLVRGPRKWTRSG